LPPVFECHPRLVIEGRERIVDWLKKKYESIEALNEAWATQCWSRCINS
jgi:beta-galactosidase GanA